MNKDEQEIFAENMKALREHHKLTLGQLAQIVGVARTTLLNYEMRTAKCNIFKGVRLAKALGTTVEQMVKKPIIIKKNKSN